MIKRSLFSKSMKLKMASPKNNPKHKNKPKPTEESNEDSNTDSQAKKDSKPKAKPKEKAKPKSKPKVKDKTKAKPKEKAKAKDKAKAKKAKSKLTRVSIFLIGCMIMPIFCVLVFWTYMEIELGKESDINKRMVFEIQRGESIYRVARRLESKQLIPSSWFFKVYLKSKHYSSLQAGEFLIPANATTKEVVHILRYSKPIAHLFTVIEGSTTGMILNAIRNNSYLSGPTPSKWDEGYLLPNTWAISKGTTRLALLNRMRKALEQVLDQEWKNRASNVAVKSKEQALILASIIEKETAIKDERFKVSAVYSNRLRRNIRLQADPTTIYGITKGQYKLSRPLKHKDLLERNEYNTYTMRGLPKTPIAVVSRESINAALHPANVDYLYFVATGHGGSIFARNYKDHKHNIRNWLKVLKEKKLSQQTKAK